MIDAKTNEITMAGIASGSGDNPRIDNPTLKSPHSPFEQPFYQTRETMMDMDVYSRFLKNAINRFRSSRTYKSYKGFLMSLGLDRSQVHSNITSEMANIEMHHNMLNIFDIAFIITEHTLQTVGYISTFDLVMLLKKEHKEHHICLVMLDETSHQLHHADKEFFIHPSMCFGDWLTFLNRYPYGITREIGYKIIKYLEKADQSSSTTDANYLKLRQQIADWSDKLC